MHTRKAFARHPLTDASRPPNGIPSVDERVNLLYTEGVKTGKIDIKTFVRTASTAAAKLFGLYPRKGEIVLGSDADLVIYDPDYRGIISVKTQLMNTDYSASKATNSKAAPPTSPSEAK